MLFTNTNRSSERNYATSMGFSNRSKAEIDKTELIPTNSNQHFESIEIGQSSSCIKWA